MEIFGFKSFADRARIDFTPGITALLGPNGCGKSNVVDAIKWVLGEQASKSLRADKMEDVIFNGTDQRKALNVAEVTLTISNERQLLALDLPEISIKRRLYRSGESEYFINGTLVRLKEVRELFYDTGVGKSAYSVMEQGRIDQILSTKPEERRYLFEEAAGITKYKARGQEAERRLERTEENLRQLEGILGEIRHNWEALKKQSEKTLVYRELKKSLFTLEKDQQLRRWGGLLESKNSTSAKIRVAATQKDRASALLQELNASLQRETLELNRSESDLVDLQRQLLSLDLTRKGILQQQTLQKERLAQYHSDSARLEAQLSSIHARQLGLQEELVQRQKDVATLTSDLSACRLNMAQYTAALEAERLAVADHEDAIRNAQQLCSDLETQDVTWQDQWRELTDILVQELDQRLKEDGFAWHKLPGLTASMEMTLAQLRTAVSGRKDLLTTLLASPVDHPDSWRSLVSQVAGSLSDSLDLLSAFEADWATYRTAIPQFLGEFLAPEGIITQKRDLENQMALGRVGIKSQKDLIRQRQESKEETLALIETHRTTLENLKVNEVRMQTLMAAAHEGVDRVAVELSAQQVQLSQTRAEQDTTAAKVLSCQKDLAGLELQQGSLGEQEAASALRKVALEAELQSRSTALAGRQEELKAHFGQVNAAQAEIDALQLIIVRLDAETQALLEHFRDKHSVSLEEFSADLSAPQDMEGNWKEAVFQKREELRLLGQINLMAVEEFTEVNDRHEFLLGQVQDLKQAREDLRRVTAEIRKESTQLFSEAFELIRVHFNNTFRRLFGGGRAELKLTEPDTVLESGIEMLCQPPGKKLESINLLSGGEKSMTAVALLFATFMVKPSPFCILDEIDAALDEANVSRFVAMLTEFSHNSQFVVITHNKKTVTGSSTMIGVTMESPGVSKILSVRLAGENEASA